MWGGYDLAVRDFELTARPFLAFPAFFRAYLLLLTWNTPTVFLLFYPWSDLPTSISAVSRNGEFCGPASNVVMHQDIKIVMHTKKLTYHHQRLMLWSLNITYCFRCCNCKVSNHNPFWLSLYNSIWLHQKASNWKFQVKATAHKPGATQTEQTIFSPIKKVSLSKGQSSPQNRSKMTMPWHKRISLAAKQYKPVRKYETRRKILKPTILFKASCSLNMFIWISVILRCIKTWKTK